MIEQAMTQFLNPPLIVKQADVKQGEVVADFGCGAGYFSLACAQAVGTDGTVPAFDILAEAYRVLRHGGKALIVEWKAMDATIGPAKDTRIGQEDLTRLVHEIGFTV